MYITITGGLKSHVLQNYVCYAVTFSSYYHDILRLLNKFLIFYFMRATEYPSEKNLNQDLQF